MVPASSGSRIDHDEIVEAIDPGGMGEVSRARGPRPPRHVAIAGASARFSHRVTQDEEVAGALNCPGISTLLDVGRDDRVMETTVDGLTLAGWLANGPSAPHDTAGLARPRDAALEHAHACGIVPRTLTLGHSRIGLDASPAWRRNTAAAPGC